MSNRRQFITLLGGVTTWPLAARAQQPERMRRIGVLMSTRADHPESQSRLAAFLQGLQEFGWVVGRNVRIDIQWGAGDTEGHYRSAAELVALAPDVILATGAASTAPLRQATRTVPIVFTIVPDPVGAGFVDSLARRKTWSTFTAIARTVDNQRLDAEISSSIGAYREVSRLH